MKDVKLNRVHGSNALRQSTLADFGGLSLESYNPDRPDVQFSSKTQNIKGLAVNNKIVFTTSEI